MKRYTRVFIVGLFFFLTFTTSAFAENRAVTINIGSNGGGDVGTTIATVRQIIGHAVGSGVVDKFIVLIPREGGPIFIEGGLTACAEASFGIINNTHQDLIKQLRSIQPESGVFLNMELTESCNID